MIESLEDLEIRVKLTHTRRPLTNPGLACPSGEVIVHLVGFGDSV